LQGLAWIVKGDAAEQVHSKINYLRQVS
jgi:hypothetical protein